jgi:hypothetical protein
VCSKSCGCSFTLQYLVAKLKSTVPSYYCSIAAPVSRLNLTFNFSCAPSRLESACLCSSLKQIRPTTGRKILRLRFVVIRLAVAEALQTDDHNSQNWRLACSLYGRNTAGIHHLLVLSLFLGGDNIACVRTRTKRSWSSFILCLFCTSTIQSRCRPVIRVDRSLVHLVCVFIFEFFKKLIDV